MHVLETIFGRTHEVTVGQECARAALIFLFGLLCMRVSGRRCFGKWSVLDIVVSIVLGSSLSRALTGSAPLLGTMAACVVLLAMHKLAPESWGKRTIHASRYVQYETYKRFPSLAQCEAHFRINTLLTRMYPGFHKSHQAKVVKRERDDDDIVTETAVRAPKRAKEKPWLTKGMLKETGFEEYFADAPITPAQYEENRQLYDPDNIFSARIEAAIHEQQLAAVHVRQPGHGRRGRAAAARDGRRGDGTALAHPGEGPHGG